MLFNLYWLQVKGSSCLDYYWYTSRDVFEGITIFNFTDIGLVFALFEIGIHQNVIVVVSAFEIIFLFRKWLLSFASFPVSWGFSHLGVELLWRKWFQALLSHTDWGLEADFDWLLNSLTGWTNFDRSMEEGLLLSHHITSLKCC